MLHGNSFPIELSFKNKETSKQHVLNILSGSTETISIEARESVRCLRHFECRAGYENHRAEGILFLTRMMRKEKQKETKQKASSLPKSQQTTQLQALGPQAWTAQPGHAFFSGKLFFCFSGKVLNTRGFRTKPLQKRMQALYPQAWTP